MTFRRITKRDNPKTLAKRAAECERILLQALSLATKLAKRQSPDVKQMIASARVQGMVNDYKVASIEYPNPKYHSTWYSNITWSEVLS